MKHLEIYIIIILSLVLVSCIEEVQLEVTEVKFEEAKLISGLNTESFRDISLVDSTFWGLTGNNDRVEIYNIESGEVKSWGKTGYGPGEFINISDISFSENFIFIFDSVKKSIEIFDKSLNYLSTIYPEMTLLSIQAESDTSFIASSFDMAQYSIIRFSGNNFSHRDYLLVESTRNPSDGIALLNLQNGNIMVSRLMTNSFSIIHGGTNRIVSVTNKNLPNRPDFEYVGGNQLPTSAVWHWGIISEDHAFQLIREQDFTILNRYTLEGKMDKIFRLDISAGRMFSYYDSYIFTSHGKVYKISKTLFK
jgi:hypothetical protein